MHFFEDSLRMSHKASDLPLWEEIYRSAFPTYCAMVDHRADGEHQRAGIDRSVILQNSKQVLIDEKIRWKPYDDIALEYLSNDRTGAPGWVCKPLRADYIAYAIAPLGRCYLLPVVQLQIAWERNSEKWLAQCPQIKARNSSYTTHSVGVKPSELFPAIGSAFRISFAPLGDCAQSTTQWLREFEGAT